MIIHSNYQVMVADNFMQLLYKFAGGGASVGGVCPECTQALHTYDLLLEGHRG